MLKPTEKVNSSVLKLTDHQPSRTEIMFKNTSTKVTPKSNCILINGAKRALFFVIVSVLFATSPNFAHSQKAEWKNLIPDSAIVTLEDIKEVLPTSVFSFFESQELLEFFVLKDPNGTSKLKNWLLSEVNNKNDLELELISFQMVVLADDIEHRYHEVTFTAPLESTKDLRKQKAELFSIENVKTSFEWIFIPKKQGGRAKVIVNGVFVDRTQDKKDMAVTKIISRVFVFQDGKWTEH